MEQVFRQPDQSVRPGDIIRLAPTFKPLNVLEHLARQETVHKGQATAARLAIANAPKDVQQGKQPARFVVEGKLEWGVLMTRGCDIDNGKERQLAILRPLKDFQLDHHANIIKGNRISLHYLPAPEDDTLGIGERVIDFRFIVTLHQSLFDQLVRPISLTRDALLDVYASWMKHTIGHSVPLTTSCPSCETEVDIFSVVQEAATPPVDY